MKQSFEKVGDHWEPKDERGPSDPQSRQRGAAARNRPKATHGGVDVYGNTKRALRASPQGGRQGTLVDDEGRAGGRARPEAGLSSSNMASQSPPISAGR